MLRVLGICAVAAVTCSAAVLTFDGVGGFLPVVENGFAVTTTGAAVVATGNDCLPGCADNGTMALYAFNEASVAVARLGGGTFSLLGFDLGETFTSYSTGPVRTAPVVRVSGTLMGGGTVWFNVSPDMVNDGPGGVADFQTVVLPMTFTNLTSVVFVGVPAVSNGGEFSLDNLNVGTSTIPEPSTFVLLGASLAAFGLVRRRR